MGIHTKFFNLTFFLHNIFKDHSKLLKESLERISVIHLSDIQQLLEILWNPDMVRFRVVIIDSLASLFLPLLGDSFNDGNLFHIDFRYLS